MRLSVVRTSALVFLVATSALADGKCSAAARECEQQIRQMLSGRRYLGIQIVELKPGLVIKSVIPDSPAETAGLLPNDRLIACNSTDLRTATAKEFKQVLAKARSTGKLFMIIQRRGALKKVETTLKPYPKDQLDKIIAQHMTQSHAATAGGQ